MQVNNGISVTWDLIRSLGVNVTKTSVKEAIEKHPSRASLFAISDLLTHWQILNESYSLSFNELVEAEIGGNFIASIDDGFVFVETISEKYLIISNERWKKKKITYDKFRAIYSGVILVADKNENSGEKDYHQKQRKFFVSELRMPFVVFSAICVTGIWLNLNPPCIRLNVSILILLLCKIAGLITSVFLLIQMIDVNNPVIRKLCGSDSDKNCNSILSSQAAKIIPEISWSEVGFFYFAGTLMMTLFALRDADMLNFLFVFSIICLPYTFYSLYYQWKVAKQWCLFCCIIQGLFWAEFIVIILSTGFQLRYPSLKQVNLIVFCMLIPITIWVLIKPYLQKSNSIKPLKAQLNNFKYSEELFDIIKAQPAVKLLNRQNSIYLGSDNPQNIITIISNPFCQPCATAHKKLNELLSTREDIALQIVFAVGEKENDKKAIVAKHLINLNLNRKDLIEEALNDWYGQSYNAYTNWISKYDVPELEMTDQIINEHRKWCHVIKVKGTPAFLINGRKLPASYHVEDIRYFL